MSRPKVDPVERAFEAVIALNEAQYGEFNAMLKGYRAARPEGQKGEVTRAYRRRKSTAPPTLTGIAEPAA